MASLERAEAERDHEESKQMAARRAELKMLEEKALEYEDNLRRLREQDAKAQAASSRARTDRGHGKHANRTTVLPCLSHVRIWLTHEAVCSGTIARKHVCQAANATAAIHEARWELKVNPSTP